MSIEAESIDHEAYVRDKLEKILEQLLIMNMIFKEAFNLDIKPSDIEHSEEL